MSVDDSCEVGDSSDNRRLKGGNRVSWLLLILIEPLLSAGLAGCDFPRDPQQTLETVRGDTLRVGVIQDVPWTYGGETSTPRGVEIELVKKLAEELNAQVQWVAGSDARLMPALERFELDLIVGGVVEDSAWRGRVGLTRPYFEASPAASRTKDERRHVFAVPPGENAWLLCVDDFLQRHQDIVPQLLQRYPIPDVPQWPSHK